MLSNNGPTEQRPSSTLRIPRYKHDIKEEEKREEAKDAVLAKKLMREEKDAILAERISQSEKMALAAQEKIEKNDLMKAKEIQEKIDKDHAREREAKEVIDRNVARTYEIRDQRLAHREARNQCWLDNIAAQYMSVYNEGSAQSKDNMTLQEFKLCHDFAAWQDAQMEIHDVMAGICVSARLPQLHDVKFEVGGSRKEVELMCISESRAGHEVRLIHKNIEHYHQLMKEVHGEKHVIPPPCNIEKLSTYSIFLQLDACVGVGVTSEDISYVYEKESGVIYVYLNGLKLRDADKSPQEETDKRGKKIPGVSRGKTSLLSRMVAKIKAKAKSWD